MDTHTRPHHETGVARDGHGEGDEAEDRRQTQTIGDDPNAETCDELEQIAAERSGDIGHDITIEFRKQNSEQHAAGRRNRQPQRPGAIEAAEVLNRGRGAEQQQGGCIVEKAFAFQHGDRAARHADTAENGRRGRRIRRGDNRAERDRGIERQSGHRDAEPRNRRGAQEHHADGQRHQRPPEPPHCAERKVEGLIDQGWRNEKCEGRARI